jgi:hypothetical protein
MGLREFSIPWLCFPGFVRAKECQNSATSYPGSQIGAIAPEAVTISRCQYATMTPVSPDGTKVNDGFHEIIIQNLSNTLLASQNGRAIRNGILKALPYISRLGRQSSVEKSLEI